MTAAAKVRVPREVKSNIPFNPFVDTGFTWFFSKAFTVDRSYPTLAWFLEGPSLSCYNL